MLNTTSKLGGATDVGHLIDESKWTPYQKWLVLMTALVIVFDGVDNQLLGVSIPTIMREWSVPRGAFASVVSLGYFGMMIGGGVAGLAGDRFGRRTVLLGSMAVFGGTTLASAFVTDTGSLGLLRFVAGMGLGGAMPNAATLAAEYVPEVATVARRHRDDCLHAAGSHDRGVAGEPGAGSSRLAAPFRHRWRCPSRGSRSAVVLAARIASLPRAPQIAADGARTAASAHGTLG